MKTESFKYLRPALLCFAIFTIVCGVAYPLIVTGAGALFFPFQANGSVVADRGSELLGQTFTENKYLIGRPQNGGAPTNLSPFSPKQNEAVETRIAEWRARDPGNTADVPMDLLTVSGSGYDPHVSPEAAAYQVPRIARERGISESEVQAVIDEYTDRRFLGFIGEERVNVLRVNLALDGIEE